MSVKETERMTVPINHKFLLTIKEAAAYSNIGINTIEKITREPGCKFVLYVGARRLIKREAFERFLEKTSEI